MTIKRKLIQIAVIGSMNDMKHNKNAIQIAKEVGREIARTKVLLLFSWEGDFLSLPVVAAKESEKFGGKTAAFLWSSADPNKDLRSMTIKTGQLRGGGREFSLVLSADVVISLGGGSGTLMEIAMAYQAGIPIVSIQNTGGWSQKLINTFLDDRKRVKIVSAKNAKDAVQKAVDQIR